MLETSDIVDKDTENVCTWYKDIDGNIKKATVEWYLHKRILNCYKIITAL